MSDRKYRQRGYQDEPRAPQPARERPPPQPRAPGRQLQDPAGPKTPNLMASHEVFRCARCGHRLAVPVELASRCERCGTDIHSCVNCVSFDTGARWECTQAALLTARVAPKDAANACTLFTPRTTVERQTGTASTPSSPSSARRAFDDLFK